MVAFSTESPSNTVIRKGRFPHQLLGAGSLHDILLYGDLFGGHESAPSLRCGAIDSTILLTVNDGRHYEARPVPAAELAIMRRIDALHMDYPFAGSRMLRDLLRGEGVPIGRELVATMMRRMGIEAIYRKPNTSKAALGHKIYPYLLRGLAIERPNQAWA